MTCCWRLGTERSAASSSRSPSPQPPAERQEREPLTECPSPGSVWPGLVQFGPVRTWISTFLDQLEPCALLLTTLTCSGLGCVGRWGGLVVALWQGGEAWEWREATDHWGWETDWGVEEDRGWQWINWVREMDEEELLWRLSHWVEPLLV